MPPDVDAVHEVTFYGRPGCHLCDDAEPSVAALARAAGARFVRVNIDESDDLVRRYGLEIPVVAVDGVDVTHVPMDLALVRAALAGVRRQA
jgi:thiol-disulfide isomerase/thioredoxin